MPTPEAQMEQRDATADKILGVPPRKTMTPEEKASMDTQIANIKASIEKLKPFFKLVSGRIKRCTEHSAGYDVFYNGTEPLKIEDKIVKVPTGVRSIFSPGFVAIMKEKSGLALKGIEVHGGVIDADYRDEWFVLMRNPEWAETDESKHGQWKPFVINPGDKIAQFIMVAIPNLRFEGEGVELSNEERTGGLGSTGKS